MYMYPTDNSYTGITNGQGCSYWLISPAERDLITKYNLTGKERLEVILKVHRPEKLAEFVNEPT